jgi:hypothetical protein
MSEMQMAATRARGWSFWGHLVAATLISLMMPYLGSAYLGLKSATEQSEWQRRTIPLNALTLVVFSLPFVVNFELTALLFLAACWALLAASSVVSLWRTALRRDCVMAIAPGGLNSLTFILSIAAGILLATVQLGWPGVILFRATETTPTVAEGELLYGLKYDPMRDDDGWQVSRLQRGHLVVARIGGNETLVRVLAVPGDIVAIDKYVVLTNGSRILLGGRIVSWPSSADALAELAQKRTSIVEPRHLLVARDTALLNPPSGEATALDIREGDVVLVPWAKFWSVGDHPGEDSDLAQPKYPFFRN